MADFIAIGPIEAPSTVRQCAQTKLIPSEALPHVEMFDIHEVNCAFAPPTFAADEHTFRS